jgi:hypothetical protein
LSKLVLASVALDNGDAGLARQNYAEAVANWPVDLESGRATQPAGDGVLWFPLRKLHAELRAEVEQLLAEIPE